MKCVRRVMALYLLGVMVSSLCLGANGPGVIVQGTGRGPDGEEFAILKDAGLVKVGAVIPVTTADERFDLVITGISKAGIRYEKRNVVPVRRETPPPDEQKVVEDGDADDAGIEPPPEKGKWTGMRDPFWPIDYWPAPQHCE